MDKLLADRAAPIKFFDCMHLPSKVTGIKVVKHSFCGTPVGNTDISILRKHFMHDPYDGYNILLLQCVCIAQQYSIASV